MTSRELVKKTLEFANTNRVPRQLWHLKWAEIHYERELRKILEDFPADIIECPEFLTVDFEREDLTKVGTSKDDWGCIFENKQHGIVGEVKIPIVKGEEWEDFENVHIPIELLEVDTDRVNEYCKNSDKFILSPCLARPFEQLQFIRSTEALYVDIALKSEGMLKFLKKMHSFYCQLIEKWAQTDVDGILFMDDWGSQKSLLINPKTWVEIFKPLYKDYIDIAHKYGKKVFMHSDGYTIDIIPHLIELGLDAMNVQIFCIGVENLQQFAGKLTFWGEIDRQHILPYGSEDDVKQAVSLVKKNLWKNGGCIAQCEFGIGAKPDNIYEVFNSWNNIAEL